MTTNKRQLKELKKVLQDKEGGIYKRIDENRELYNLLEEKAPEVLSELFWISDWLDSNDRFLTALAEKGGVINTKAKSAPIEYPRSFGGKLGKKRQGKA